MVDLEEIEQDELPLPDAVDIAARFKVLTNDYLIGCDFEGCISGSPEIFSVPEKAARRAIKDTFGKLEIMPRRAFVAGMFKQIQRYLPQTQVQSIEQFTLSYGFPKECGMMALACAVYRAAQIGIMHEDTEDSSVVRMVNPNASFGDFYKWLKFK